MTQDKQIGVLVSLFILFLLMSQSLFIVNEGQRSIILRFQEIYKDSDGKSIVFSPGLHIKFPLIDSVYPMTVKIQTAESVQTNMITKGDVEESDINEFNEGPQDATKFLLVDFYVKYRIIDPGVFYQTIKTTQRFNKVILSRAEMDIKQAIAKSHFSDVIRGDQGARSKISQDIRETLSKEAEKSYGVEVIDVRFKKVDLDENVANSVFDRMIAVQKKNSTEIRTSGDKLAKIIQATADRDATISLQMDIKKAKETIAEGKKKAAIIYNDAYTKNSEFYKFQRSLQSYKLSIKDNDLLVMSPDDYSYLASLKKYQPPKTKKN